MGFPGALDVTATYALGAAGTPALSFGARTDRPTVANLTNHAYFDLAGTGAPDDAPREASGGILRHMLRIDADSFLPVSTESIPWGPQQRVAGTPFDFTTAHPIGDGLRAPDPRVKAADGYDHCWVLRPPADPAAPRTAAALHDPGSGRTLEVRTTEPGIQVHTANKPDGSLAGADGRRYGPHSAVCLETQHLPESPNRPGYPPTVLRPGEVLRGRSEFRFPHLPGGGS